VAAEDSKAFLGKGWAFPVALEPSGKIGLIAYEEDIRQSVHIILGTAQGERVMRPDFGAGLEKLVFEPMNTTTKSLVRHQVEQALIRWEPRIEVQEVLVEPDTTTSGKLLIEIRYRVRDTNTFYNLVYPFYLQEGQP
jgi:phage baseplate assembly protein W